MTGVVTAKGDNWIEVKADGEEKARRYVPHWKGGLPKDGGGPDKDMVAKIKETAVNSRVRLEWEFEERATRREDRGSEEARREEERVIAISRSSADASRSCCMHSPDVRRNRGCAARQNPIRPNTAGTPTTRPPRPRRSAPASRSSSSSAASPEATAPNSTSRLFVSTRTSPRSPTSSSASAS